MKKSQIVFIMILGFLFLFSGCASMNLANYQFAGEKVVFETDFSEMPESARDWQDNDQVIFDAEKGLVHLRAKKGEGTGFTLEEHVTRNSRVSFRFMPGEDINPPHPQSHINLLVRAGAEYQRLCINIDDKGGISYFWYGSGSRGNGYISEKTLKMEQWYQIDILLNGDTGILFIDGKRLGSFTLSDKLPGWGNMGFECHNEYWIDDVRITHYKSYVVEKQE